jgi:hypothetical protein
MNLATVSDSTGLGVSFCFVLFFSVTVHEESISTTDPKIGAAR